MKNEKRKYQRVGKKVPVQFYEESIDNSVSQLLTGVIENCSEVGIFISTEYPLLKGSVVTVFCEIESESQEFVTVQMRGIVRWVRRFPGNRGMGLEIFESKKQDEKDVVSKVTDLSQKPSREDSL